MTYASKPSHCSGRWVGAGAVPKSFGVVVVVVVEVVVVVVRIVVIVVVVIVVVSGEGS